MPSRVVVVAVLAVAVVAAADAVLGSSSAPRVSSAPVARATAAPPPGVSSRGAFDAAGNYLQTRVVRNGEEYLSAEAVDDAFPSRHEGPFDIADLALAPDGTLALAVYRFPADHPAHAAIELWRDRRLVGAFTVPPGTAGGGVAFSENGELVLLTAIDGQRLAYTRSGRRAL